MAVLVTTMAQIIYPFGCLFVVCEMGQRINLAFAQCIEMFDQFEWYLFPDGIQRMLPMIFYLTQQPFEIICFGSAACDRETFKSVSIAQILLKSIEINQIKKLNFE